MNKQPKRVGIQSCMHIQTKLIDLGYDISIPIGDNSKYDLIVDVNGKLLKIQCKTARIERGTIAFNLTGSRINMSGCYKISYEEDEVDAFIAYMPDSDSYYLLQNKNRPKYTIYLCPDVTKTRKTARTRDAKDFLLTKERLDNLVF